MRTHRQRLLCLAFCHGSGDRDVQPAQRRPNDCHVATTGAGKTAPPSLQRLPEAYHAAVARAGWALPRLTLSHAHGRSTERAKEPFHLVHRGAQSRPQQCHGSHRRHDSACWGARWRFTSKQAHPHPQKTQADDKVEGQEDGCCSLKKLVCCCREAAGAETSPCKRVLRALWVLVQWHVRDKLVRVSIRCACWSLAGIGWRRRRYPDEAGCMAPGSASVALVRCTTR